MNRITLRQIANLVSFIVIIIATFLLSPTPNSPRSRELDLPSVNTSSVLFYPADVTFAVWLPIFVLLGAFAIYQVRPGQRNNPLITRVGYWFVFSMACYTAFTVCVYLGQLTVASLMVLGQFAALLIIHLRAEIGVQRPSRSDLWFVQIPLQTYLGWISVATILTFAEFLVQTGWNGFGVSAETWTVLLTVIASMIALFLLVRRRSVAFLLVVMWAILGVAIAHPAYAAIQTSVAVLEVILALALILWIVARGRGLTAQRQLAPS
jgi:hypothetical protein